MERACPNQAPFTLADYAASLQRSGARFVAGTSGTFWRRHESVAVMRFPDICFDVPPPEEVRRVLRRSWAIVASFLREPDETHPANAFLYVAQDTEYSLDSLAPVMRRNVRRALKDLTFDWLTEDQVLAHGHAAFCDTRRRNGLNDGTPSEFRRRFERRTQCPAHTFLGAWKGGELAAFLSLTECDDWSEIEGCFSCDRMLDSRPNDGLMFTALGHYLVERRLRLVHYGLSSLQPSPSTAGLHTFKEKVGFRPVPVHRVITFHPVLEHVANRLTLGVLKGALAVVPRSRRLRKAVGALRLLMDQSAVSQRDQSQAAKWCSQIRDVS